MRRDTLIDFFDDLSRARGEFLVYDDGFRSRSYTYEEVGRAARGFAARLASQGLVRGDKVVFFSENRPEWVIAFWGCLLSGIVVVPIDYRTSPDFLARVAGIVNAKLVLDWRRRSSAERNERRADLAPSRSRVDRWSAAGRQHRT